MNLCSRKIDPSSKEEEKTKNLCATQTRINIQEKRSNEVLSFFSYNDSSNTKQRVEQKYVYIQHAHIRGKQLYKDTYTQ